MKAPVPPQSRNFVTMALMVIVLVATGVDVVIDLQHGTPLNHVIHELSLMAAAVALLAWILRDLRARRREITELDAELEALRTAAPQRNPVLMEARTRLSEAIDLQFADWGLSPSECEVGRLLLKGLSLKEVAALRDTREKTVRQQASAIYRKAELPGRHAFAAWFIEDLL